MNWRFKKKAPRLRPQDSLVNCQFGGPGIKATGVYLNVPLGELRFLVRVDDGAG